MGQLTFPQTDTQTYGQPPIVSDSAVLDAAATTLTLRFENQDIAAQTIVARLYFNTVNSFLSATQIGSQTAPFDATGHVADQVFSVSGVGPGFVWGWWGCSSPTFTATVDMTLFDDLVYCGYGSRVKTGYTDWITLDPVLLQSAIAAVASSGAWGIVAFFAGQLFNVSTLCANPRPTPVILTTTDMVDLAGGPFSPNAQAVAAKARVWLNWALWPALCECTPGSPSPYDPPIIIDHRTGTGTDSPTSTFLCDNTDLCSVLLRVEFALATMRSQQQQMRGVLDYVQRQGVPDTYAYGSSHAGLTGDGDFGVASILGLSITFTTLPSTYPSFGGDPDMYHQLGRISLGTADGWERSWWATHSPYLILPISAAVTKVGWTFPSGIVATITELVRTP